MMFDRHRGWRSLARFATGLCISLTTGAIGAAEPFPSSRPLPTPAAQRPLGQVPVSPLQNAGLSIPEDGPTDWMQGIDDSVDEHSGILPTDFAEAPPAPIAQHTFSLEDRLRDLEMRLMQQQNENELFRNQLAEIGKKKDEKPDPKSMKASWKHQLNFESADKNFSVHLGGRTQLDTVWLHSNPAAFGVGNNGGSQDSANFRRARLRADGTIYKTIDYAVEYDFVNSQNDNAGLVGGLPAQPASAANVIQVPAPTDAYFTFRETPIVGNVKVGQQKEPIGLEHLTSSRYLDFMERSFNQDAYTGPSNNGFSLGAMAFDNFGEGDRGLWQVGVFKNSANAYCYALDDGAYAFDSRLTYLVWDECEGRQLLHIGGAYSHRDPLNNSLTIRSRGSLRNGPGALNPVFASSGAFMTDTQDLYCAEMALVLGSFQLQSEYIASTASNATNGGGNHGTYFTNGYYVMASYFLTGENRAYDKKAGTFARVVPYRNSRWCPEDGSEAGYGAWQILVRYSNLDLDDNGINGGQLQDYTAGLNWFLNPNLKIQANYVFTDRDSLGSPVAPGAGGIHGFGMRLAHDF
jgi:phosphate-selective porin OprO and OprP